VFPQHNTKKLVKIVNKKPPTKMQIAPSVGGFFIIIW